MECKSTCIVFKVKPCDIESDNLVKCETPEYSGNGSLTGKVSETVNVHFDGLKVPVTIDYVGDPRFEHFSDVIEYERDAAIEIMVNMLFIYK